jgi:hypothetical protein
MANVCEKKYMPKNMKGKDYGQDKDASRLS